MDIRERRTPPAGLGDMLRAARVRVGLDLATAAKRAGIGAPYLSTLERGRKAPGRATIAKLGETLSLSPEVLAALYADEKARRTAHPWRGPGRMLGYRPRPA